MMDSNVLFAKIAEDLEFRTEMEYGEGSDAYRVISGAIRDPELLEKLMAYICRVHEAAFWKGASTALELMEGKRG